MDFKEQNIARLDLTKPRDMLKCIELLCNQESVITDKEKYQLNSMIKTLCKSFPAKELDFAHLNEILLLLNQGRVSEGFFSFFFNPQQNRITLDEMRNGVIKFRGYAMLCYGDFRYAYKVWPQLTKAEIDEDVRNQCCFIQLVDQDLKSRSHKILDVKHISRDKLCYLGYISSTETQGDVQNLLALNYKADPNNLQLNKLPAQYAEEVKRIAGLIDSSKLNKWKPKMSSLQKELDRIQEDIESTQKVAEDNTNIYLTWDYMDIYIATSMRERWEYEETYDFTQEIFNHKDIAAYNLRFFNPTQCYVSDRIQKGLLEALMLKRAYFTIYLAQETDSLGKDSELAITLAQGKPVIAYVPRINKRQHAEKISKYPLRYFLLRLPLLDAQQFLSQREIGERNYQTVKDFRNLLAVHFSERIFNYHRDEEEEFKHNNEVIFRSICRILANAEKSYFDKRAETLRKSHPLGFQVDLATGVANGVIIVRDKDQCREIVKRLLKGEMKFEIKRIKENFILEEELTHSYFRVVTGNKRIANTFWNFYLQ